MTPPRLEFFGWREYARSTIILVLECVIFSSNIYFLWDEESTTTYMYGAQLRPCIWMQLIRRNQKAIGCQKKNEAAQNNIWLNFIYMSH